MSHLVKSMRRIFLPKIHHTYRLQNVTQFEDGRDYFSYQEPIEQIRRSDSRIPIQFFFDYDCRVCSSAQDILQLYSQIRPNKVELEEYPVATNEARFSATIFYTLQRLKVGELSDTLLFETSEKARYTELSTLDKMREWVISQGNLVKLNLTKLCILQK